MKISAKGRYALASLLYIAENSSPDDCITISSISKALSISKIYLEQTFSLLKKADIVHSIKGAQGGYQLSKSIKEISTLDVLLATEVSLFEPTELFISKSDPVMDQTLYTLLFSPLEENIQRFFASITLYDLLENLKSRRSDGQLMFYI